MINQINTLKVQSINIDNIVNANNSVYLLTDSKSIFSKDIATLAKTHLHSTEQTVLQRRHSLQAKQEFIASRVLLKTYIAKKLKLNYHELRISFSESVLELQAFSKNKLLPLKLSLSHSNGLVFLAVWLNNNESAIGVDIEYHHPKRDTIALATEFFHKNEIEQLKSQHKHYFFTLWTLKEAVTKMRKVAVVDLLKTDIFAMAKQYHAAIVSNTDYTLAVAATSKLTNRTIYHVQLWDL